MSVVHIYIWIYVGTDVCELMGTRDHEHRGQHLMTCTYVFTDMGTELDDVHMCDCGHRRQSLMTCTCVIMDIADRG